MQINPPGFLALGIFVSALTAFLGPRDGTIRGSVSPVEAVVRVWIISSTDTIRSEVREGVFACSGLRPGVYKLIVEARAPFKYVVKHGILLGNNKVADLGQILLMQ
jgi:hypothetical protein